MSALSDHILSSIDIVSLIDRYVSLKKAGTNYAWLCPFHSEKSPSFLVSPSKQIYKCFWCGKGWNAINFFMEIERIDYGDAIRKLAEEHHIDLGDFESKRQSSPEYKSEKEKIKRMIKLAQEFFVSELKNNKTVLEYLTKNRWLSDELIVQLGLGYAPSQSQPFFSYFQGHGFSVEDLVQAWLVKMNEERKDYYAFFRDRLIVPIRDQLGNVIAFGARALQSWQEPKYLNSSDSIIYDKSQTLYGIDHLKKWVKDHKAIIVVEWYFDVIALTIAGMDIGVATCGTSLTTQHITTLKRYSDNICFLFDNDNAGTTATLRWLAIAYAQGIYPKIITLWWNHKDIDEVVRNNAKAQDEVQELLQKASDSFVWAIAHYKSHHDIASPVERQKVLQGLFDLIYAVVSVSTQNLFLEQMSHHLHMDYTLIVSQYKQYIKTEKKLFWPRSKSKLEDNKEHIKQERIDQKLLILSALLYENFRESIDIDWERISFIQQFISVANISIVQSAEQVSERQIRWEKEISNLWDSTKIKNTLFAKQVLVPYLHMLQKTALKHLSDADKQKLLLLSAKIR